MAKNKFKEPVEEIIEQEVQEAVKPKPRKRSMKGARRLIKFLRVFGIFNRHQIVNTMPFILFCTVLTLFYIGNSYYAERTIREIDKIKTDLKEKRAEFISTKSELMYRSKQSEVAGAIEGAGVKEATEPSKKIVLEQSSEEKK